MLYRYEFRRLAIHTEADRSKLATLLRSGWKVEVSLNVVHQSQPGHEIYLRRRVWPWLIQKLAQTVSPYEDAKVFSIKRS